MTDQDDLRILNDKRIRIIVGHFGSGKTEFSVNYAVKLAEQGKKTGEKTEQERKTALVDLDIANPYFRSRERRQLLEEKGVQVYSNTFGYDITADLPAITAGIRAPLEDPLCRTVVDAGGNETGAKILIQFEKYWNSADCDLFCVVNANRPETGTAEGAIAHIAAIERETGLKITGLVNNTHMLAETQAEDILKGYRLCRDLSAALGIPVKYSCCTEETEAELKKRKADIEELNLFRIKLYMRESWLDR
jgi:hypothetical protein